MNYITHNQADLFDDVNCTSLVAQIVASYKDLVAAFGEPTAGCGKSDVEWLVKFDDGTVATVYNWKNGPAYCGEAGTPVKQIKQWNVGGHAAAAYQKVFDVVRKTAREVAHA